MTVPRRRYRPTPSTGYPLITGTLELLSTIAPIAVGPRFAEDLAMLAGVRADDVDAHLRLGHIIVSDGRVQSWRSAAQ